MSRPAEPLLAEDVPPENDPTLDDFHGMAAEALATVPEPFRQHIKGVVIRTAEWPEDDVLEEMGVESPYDLLGLYQGVALTERSVNDVANYGGIPSNLPAALVVGHACRQHPPSTSAGVAEDFSSPHINGVNFLFADGSIHAVRTSVNMQVYPFTATIADGLAVQVDF